ncbi:Crp/Fnr family transcriptional regulator [Pedobacter helvus]|uniref:Crp/Fnr family transcriptional regulator n=1 Tax=Pedobacter helvus TaxID=2563444 RepID=A0ABW9JIZ7_9SPHI|nr:Crp/Fnr family transcriptional regulator [Pedobacter ureilyticus]
MEYASFLRQHIEQIFPLSDEEFELVKSYFKPKEIAKKEYLIKAGQKVTSEFLVEKGLLKAFLFDEKGREHIIQFAMENWWISDYPAYAKQHTGEMCVQALENCFVLELSLEDKNQLCEALPKMYRFYGQKSFGGFVAQQKRVLSMMKNSPNEKYELLLDQYPQLFQRVSKTMIAHFLGVSRETLSRLHKK